MALASTLTSDFGGGIYRGKRSPDNAVYDATNLLVDDEAHLFKRGGDAYYSASDAGSTITRLGSFNFSGPDLNRVVAWGQKIYVLNGTTPLEIFDSTTSLGAPYTVGRPASVGGIITFPASPAVIPTTTIMASRFIYYGGSLLPSGGATADGTVTFTNGSAKLTKVGGTTFVGHVDPGMFVSGPTAGDPYAIVRSVDGADSLTLVSPWAGATASSGATWDIRALIVGYVAKNTGGGIPASQNPRMASSGQRLLVGVGNRVYESTRGFPFSWDPDIYQELPAAAEIIGLEGVGDTTFVFTTRGVGVISNVSLDPVDDLGNVSQTVQMISGEVVLWGDLGITPWAAGTLIVPAIDDIYAMGVDGSVVSVTGDSSNERVRRLYRSYTATDGYQPGISRVYHGHLFMPIINGSTVVDVLVCRLDRAEAWTRLAGHAAGLAYAVHPGSASAAPKLLSLSGQRVTNLTGCFTPTSSNTTDADGTAPTIQLTTRDYPAGGQQGGFAQRLRLRYELTAPTTTDTFERADELPLADPPWKAWTGIRPSLVSHVLRCTDGGIDDATHSTSLPADSFCQATFTNLAGGGDYIGVGIRLTAHADTANGYTFEVSSSGVATLRKGASFTSIASVTGSFTPHVDGIRIVAAGTEITGYFRIAGVWTQVVTATDATYSAGGYPGFWINTLNEDDNAIDEVTFGPGTAPATVGVEFSSDQDAGAWTALTDFGEQGGGTGGGLSDGARYQWWTVGKKRERIRFRITVSGACSSFILRSLELLTRPSGRQ